MGKIRVKLYYPEFTNVMLSLYALSGLDPKFGGNYKLFKSRQKEQLTDKDWEYIDLWKQEMTLIAKDQTGWKRLLEIVYDYHVENLIMFERRIRKEFGSYDLKNFNRIYLYLHPRISKDYKLFHHPITTTLNRLERQIKELKMTDHLERFMRFLEKEKKLQFDHDYFLSCDFFAPGGRATFKRIHPNLIRFSLPILFNAQGNLTFDFDEQVFLDQIFYNILSLQFESKKPGFSSLLVQHQINEIHFHGGVVGAVHYGIYTYDIHRERLKMEKVTDHLERQLTNPRVDKIQVNYAMKLIPLIERFYQDRAGLDEIFIKEAATIYTEWQEAEKIKHKEVVDDKKINQAEKGQVVVFES